MTNNYVPISALSERMSQSDLDRAFDALPDLRGVLAYVFPYLAPGREGNISLYARGQDYHIVVKNELSKECDRLKNRYPSACFVPFVDASPFPEVYAAAKAGLGVIGKNNLLITPYHGSFVFIGLIATNLEETGGDIQVSACINCGRCVSGCPSGALKDNGFDAPKCLSDITQRKGELTPAERELIKSCGTVWGCDVCQLVCPMNKDAGESNIREFREDLISSIKASDIPATNREFKAKYGTRAFSWRGRAPLARNTEIAEDKE